MQTGTPVCNGGGVGGGNNFEQWHGTWHVSSLHFTARQPKTPDQWLKQCSVGVRHHVDMDMEMHTYNRFLS